MKRFTIREIELECETIKPNRGLVNQFELLFINIEMFFHYYYDSNYNKYLNYLINDAHAAIVYCIVEMSFTLVCGKDCFVLFFKWLLLKTKDMSSFEKTKTKLTMIVVPEELLTSRGQGLSTAMAMM